jgi:SulP family sulfate permease
VAIFRIHGPFLFGVTDKISSITDNLDELPEIVIVRLRNMMAIDATGLRALEDVAAALRESGRTLLLCGAREQPAAVMRAAEFDRHIGERNVCASIGAAITRAREIHAASLITNPRILESSNPRIWSPIQGFRDSGISD